MWDIYLYYQCSTISQYSNDLALKKEARKAESENVSAKETASSLTFAQVVGSYFDQYSQSRKQSSITTANNNIFNYLLPEFGKMQIDSSTAKHVMNYYRPIRN